MNSTWDLSPIYGSIDSMPYKNDKINYMNKIKSLNLWSGRNFSSPDNPVEKLEYYIKEKNELAGYNKLLIYLNLLLSTDTSDEMTAKEIDEIENIEIEKTAHETQFAYFLKEINNIEEIISSSEILKQYEFYIKEMKKYGEHILSAPEEKIISSMKKNGSSLLKKQWEQLSSNLLVKTEKDGKEDLFPLSVIRNFAYSSDSVLRKKAYESEIKSYEQIETAAAFSLNGIKGEVIFLSKARGYLSPLDMTLDNSLIDKNILDAMCAAIKENLPKMQKYFLKKAEILGHKNGLPFYDLFAPIDDDIKFTYDEAKSFIIENFSKYSQKLGVFAKNAFNKNWIDVFPKKGKVSGAFCEGIHSIKESRVLTNFAGTLNDAVTLAHELGHAYHDLCLYNEKELNCEYPMPIAETASTFCETLVLSSALKTSSPREKRIILENDLSGITQTITDIYSRFLFEDEVFKRREKGFVSVNELKEIMINAQKEAYGKGLDENYLHPYMWACKPHYYDADFNYYNFPYAFGVLLSKGLYSLYLEDKDGFVVLYDKMLSLTGKNTIADCVKLFGIDLYDIDFWRFGFKLINEEIDDFVRQK